MLLNGSGKSDLIFTEAGGVIPANGQWEAQAVRSAQAQVEERLARAFAELDCQTGDVDVRRQLYAAFVQTAISMARHRLPGNPFLEKFGRHLPWRRCRHDCGMSSEHSRPRRIMI